MNHSRTFTFALLLALALLLAACGGIPSQQATPAPAAPTAAPASDAISTPAPSPTAPPADEHAETIKSWSAPPPLTIDPSKTYLATFKTAKGDITAELYADKAPNTVNNFIFLAKQGFYDNTTFHRVLADFMAQGGDPTGSGMGGPGYTFADEIDPFLNFDRAGLLAMANSGPNTNGSQFFITFAPTPWLNSKHTIFGEIVKGAEVLDKLTRRDPEQNTTTPGDTLLTIEISEAATSQRPTPTPTPTPFAPDPTADDHFMASLAPDQRVGYWNSAPASALETGQIYQATFRTTVGDIVVELMPDRAPQAVNNFIALARAGYYDGTHFFQVIPDLVAVGGDPLDNGSGSPGYTIPDELTTNIFNDAGWLGAAQPSPDSNNGQFFFTLGPAGWLAERFTPLGRVVKGAEYLKKFEMRDPEQATESKGTLLQRVDITTVEASQMPTPTATPTPFAPTLPPASERPLDKVPVEQRNSYYNTAPKLLIDPKKDYIAILRTELGDITVDLFEKDTPMTVNNFVLLALNGFYDGLTFHRVLENFMAQSGDPTGIGTGGPGYNFADEFVPTLRHDRPGTLSMANRGPDTNGSQFFLTFEATSWLDDKHTLFGIVTDGMDVLKQIKLRDPADATEPGTKINRIDIETK